MPGSHRLPWRCAAYTRAKRSFMAGDEFHPLYVVRSGCFKTVYTDWSGSEQILGFPMNGDLIGADGIDSGHYASAAVSLGTSDVVIVP